MEVGMSKLWEAIKDTERERDRSNEERARTEGDPQVLAAYLEEIRQRPREHVDAPQAGSKQS
jgi:hypothetical protein